MRACEGGVDRGQSTCDVTAKSVQAGNKTKLKSIAVALPISVLPVTSADCTTHSAFHLPVQQRRLESRCVETLTPWLALCGWGRRMRGES